MSSDALVSPYEYACALFTALCANPSHSTISAVHPNVDEINKLGFTTAQKESMWENLLISSHLSETAQGERKADCRSTARLSTNS